MRLALSLALACAVLTSAPLAAQGQARQGDSVPAGHRPPAGMCRIWLPNVPAGKQAAPTDCPTAVRNRPPNAKVIFGDPLPVRSGKPEKTPIIPLPHSPTKKKEPPTKKAPPPPIPLPIPPPDMADGSR
jgi:hypothetical protein